jgi:hypothetical protein
MAQSAIVSLRPAVLRLQRDSCQSEAAAGRIPVANQGARDMSEESGDFTTMDDPEFLAERSRVREELEHTPEHTVSGELAARYQRLHEEFIRRARLAWAQAS